MEVAITILRNGLVRNFMKLTVTIIGNVIKTLKNSRSRLYITLSMVKISK